MAVGRRVSGFLSESGNGGVQQQVDRRVSYPALDLTRFGAALAVTLYHLAYWWWIPGASASPSPFIAVTLFRWGWIGVQVFFVLSGFVIAFSAEAATLTQFVARRVLRLFPAVWICATLTFVLVVHEGHAAIFDYFRTLILSPIGPWISGVYWTLAIEITFYASVALCLWRGWRLSALANFIGVASGCYWLLRATDFLLGAHFKAVFGVFDSPLGGLTLLPHGCFFALGMALHEWKRGSSPSAAFRLAVVSAIAGTIQVAAAARFLLASQGGSQAQLLDPILIWAFSVTIIILSVVCNNSVWSVFHKYAPTFRILGLMTYPLYLLHNEAGHILMLRLQPLGTSVALTTAVLSVVVMALLVTKIERYPREALKYLLLSVRNWSRSPVRHRSLKIRLLRFGGF